MKKEYITPDIEIVQLKIHGMLAASPPGWDGKLGSRELDFDEFDTDDIISTDDF